MWPWVVLLVVGQAGVVPGLMGPFAFHDDFSAFTKNVTYTLDSLLSNNYDKRIRPGLGGPPIQVGVNMYIKSLGPVSETDEMYTMDVYFRQTWQDDRLRFQLPGLDELSMSWLFLDKVWKPDTFFMNGKKSYLHKITSPNRFLRIKKDGFLMYSMRLTISASCKMHLRKFPFDSQKCPLIIGSYAYTAQDLVYRWTENAVGLEPGLETAQYALTNINVSGTLFAKRAKDQFSVVQVTFHLERSMGYFLLQIYIPCCLIVVSSWVSFWINPTDAPGRVPLAATTVLSITTMGIGGRTQLPKVSYATAMDWFFILCLSFAFAVAIEYAIINFMDKMRADFRKVIEEHKKIKAEKLAAQILPTITVEDVDGGEGEKIDMIDEESEEHKWEQERKKRLLSPRRCYSVPDMGEADTICSQEEWESRFSGGSSTDSELGERRLTSWSTSLRETLKAPYRFWQSIQLLPRIDDSDLQQAPVKKFTKIDIAARKVFPMTFTLLLAIYTFMYMFYITDVVPGEEGPDLLVV